MTTGMPLTIPREVVLFATPGKTVYKYPDWARWVVYTVQGAQGGAASDGTPGEVPKPIAIPPMEICDHGPECRYITITVGGGGRHGDASGTGQCGSVTIELYDEEPFHA